MFIKNNTIDLDLKPKAKDTGASNTSNETNKVGNQLAPYKLGMHFLSI